jgi:hypothetical protein
MATWVEIAPRVSESYHDSRELDCNVAKNESLGNKESNTQFEVQIGGEEEQSPDDQVNNPDKSDDKYCNGFKAERFMERVTESFDNLQSKIYSDITNLVKNVNAKTQAENSR